MARSAGRERTVCETCDLPYYADAGACPYCGADESGFVFGTAEPAGRARTTCPACGLPHYEDADGCPYCAYAGSESETDDPATVERVEPEPEPEREPEPGPGTGAARDADAGGGLVARLKRALGF